MRNEERRHMRRAWLAVMMAYGAIACGFISCAGDVSLPQAVAQPGTGGGGGSEAACVCTLDFETSDRACEGTDVYGELLASLPDVGVAAFPRMRAAHIVSNGSLQELPVRIDVNGTAWADCPPEGGTVRFFVPVSAP